MDISMLNWKQGRQGTGYLKFKLLSGKDWDCYLLKFPEGSRIAPHWDPVEQGREHHRLNIILKNAKQGGKFKADEGYFRWRRIIAFRPDVTEHRVTTVVKGTRYVLSIGWKH